MEQCLISIEYSGHFQTFDSINKASVNIPLAKSSLASKINWLGYVSRNATGLKTLWIVNNTFLLYFGTVCNG